MSKALVLMLMMAGTQALACPDFSGTWLCNDDQGMGQSKLELTQEGLDITFQNEDETFLIQADDVLRDIEIDVYGTPTMGWSIGYCNNEGQLEYSTAIPAGEDTIMFGTFLTMFKNSDTELKVNLYKNSFPGNYVYAALCQKQ